MKVPGQPWGAAARITVRGPNGYVRRLTGAAILRKLRPGWYRITAKPLSSGFPDYWTFDPTVETPAVRVRRVGRVYATVRYVRQPRASSQIVVDIATGFVHACALTAAGTVKCWGDNSYGQIGDGTRTQRPVPVRVPGLTGVTDIAAGDWHTCAVTIAGAAFCWGANGSGQLGDGTTTRRLRPVPVNRLEDGVAAIEAGAGVEVPDEDWYWGEHTCAVMEAGGVLCWGRNDAGQLGDGTTTDRPEPVPVGGLTGVSRVGLGTGHTCAVTNAGAAFCWGSNEAGQIGNGAETYSEPDPVAVSGLTSGVTAIEGGAAHSCAVVGGAAKCWGTNGLGQLGNGTRTPSRTPVSVSGLTSGVTSVSAGSSHSCAIVAGAAKCWGDNYDGQLGDGTRQTRLTPTPVRYLASGVVALSSNNWYGCAVTTTSFWWRYPGTNQFFWLPKPLLCWSPPGPIRALFGG